jgi:hypothetical protein
LALTGRLALPADYAMHRYDGGSNPRLESPVSRAQRGLTRVDRKGGPRYEAVKTSWFRGVPSLEDVAKMWVIGGRPAE